MDKLSKNLTQILDDRKHEINADEIIIYVASNRKTCRIPVNYGYLYCTPIAFAEHQYDETKKVTMY